MEIRLGRARTTLLAAVAATVAIVTPIAVAARGTEPASSPTTTVPRFADGAEASTAAVGLIRPYIESQFDVDVSDVACSEPDSGDEGAEFVCYGLKPNALVIALLATIGADKTITLELVTNQQPPPPSDTNPG